MAQVLKLNEKNEDRFFSIKDTAQLHRTALHILTERLQYTYWYLPDDPDYGKIEKIVQASKDPMAGKVAWNMLRSRSYANYEYEGLELIELEEI